MATFHFGSSQPLVPTQRLRPAAGRLKKGHYSTRSLFNSSKESARKLFAKASSDSKRKNAELGILSSTP